MKQGESEAATSGDVKSRLKKKAVSGLQRKDSMYCSLFDSFDILPCSVFTDTHISVVTLVMIDMQEHPMTV